MTRDDDTQRHRPATRLAHAGRWPREQHGFVNPPVYHGSTVTFPDVETMLSGRQRYVYGRRGNPTAAGLESALTELEGAAGTVLVPSGLAAVSTALLSCLSAGDHLLMIDTAYHPTRHLCDTTLKRYGIETSYFDPLVGEGIAALIRPETKAVYLEAPGSLTFEMPDIPAIAAAAKARGLTLLMDNTWATPLFFRPLEHGIDLSIAAGTKYLVGHSDVMMGTVSASAAAWPALKATHGNLGLCAGPDDIYLALRGLRTMGVRLARHQESALAVAAWLADRPEVARVLHPGLAGDPGHAIWARDFAGACGLFSFVTRKAPLDAVKAMLDGLELFGLGYSWGGFESLAIVSDPRTTRSATTWTDEGHLIRLHIGLEDTDDLIADLAAGLERFSAVQ
ncbi:cystathionine beta-lyase [Methylobrevis pamukkalensis]|uniref:Cystathionine beta-lyase MetC n=1 Tax=Methylobrevis pamukkalensis TaxID=1439726 RepID=A0A1E3H3F3_9HYPH|nr:cystathionine beta-lyase [Methylobrevis pamukkalensis]ODN70326.1 Cystathionine beta-lyase MetC [Methylobrevis pamukkalensis]